jgi:hypothetical protein
LLLEEIEVQLLPRLVLLTAAVEDREAASRSLILGSSHHVVVERILAVQHHEPHRRADAGAQLTGRVVAHVAELLDRAFDALDRVGRHLVRAVEHVGYRADRDASTLGDIADFDAHSFSLVRCTSRPDNRSARSYGAMICDYTSLKRT